MAIDKRLLSVPTSLKVTRSQFEELARENRDIRLEKRATGELTIMPPTGGNTGRRNIEIEGQLWLWNRQTRLGVVFNSSTAFHLPNGAIFSPDAAWISHQRWNNLTAQQQDSFPPLCPDFAIELRSRTARMSPLRQKIQEYLDNGLALGWLIDTKNKKVEVYRQDREVEVLENTATLSAEDVLPGFILDLQGVWN